jgi:hypothetical protein
MRTTITHSPKNNSSIRRADLSTAGVDEHVPTIGLVVLGSETDCMFGRVGSARLSLSSERQPGVSELCPLVELRSCAIAESACKEVELAANLRPPGPRFAHRSGCYREDAGQQVVDLGGHNKNRFLQFGGARISIARG